jgi:TRAP-type C4-dicarboxylate transport system permease small subunit
VERLVRWLEVPIKGLLWLGLAAGLAMMVHVALDVVGRTVFKHPLPGTTEIVAAYYMVAVAYLPWAWLARNDGHIVAEYFTRKLSPRVAFLLDIAAKAVTALFVAAFTWQTFLRAIRTSNAMESWQTAAGYLPIWPSRWLLPVAGSLMVATLLLRIVSDLASGSTRARSRE